MIDQATRDRYRVTIGIECHVQLKTVSKLFSGADNDAREAAPNTLVNHIDFGLPGALPVLNAEAVRLAAKAAFALGTTPQHFSKFDRKHYFYPDLPLGYQITQFDEPIVIGGTVIAEVDGEEKAFEVDHVHLEDDAGMLKHFSNFAGVDYNRAGVPLIEIVSKPCIHSAKEAVAYALAIKAILQYIDASDCNMEEGSLRVDANISVRLKGEEGLRNKIEIKNMNSFSNMELAIEAEIKRQIREYLNHPNKPSKEVIHQSTYRWNPELKQLDLMRRKEGAADYRYFPEPDLVPIILTEAYIEEVRSQLPELPLQRERRYVKEYALSAHSAFILTSDKNLADYFEKALALCNNPKNLCNWLIVEFSGRLKEKGVSIQEHGIPPEHLAKLVRLIDQGIITGRIAKSVADDMMATPGKDPESIVKENPDYQPVNDHNEIESLVDQVLSANAQSIADYRSGRDKAFAFLVGQVMKLTKGKASPAIVNDLIKKKIAS